MSYNVGVCQFQPIFMEPERNRNKMLEMVKDINADLIVFPELATSGYTFNNLDELKAVAENAQTGQTAKQFKQLAKENNCSYVIGFPERVNSRLTIHDSRLTYYNSSMLVNPDGTIHIYRKTHLFWDEKLYFTPGNTGFQVFEAKNGVRIGMMICFDWFFPESARTLMLNGANVIAHPANLVLPWCQQAMITRSLENRVFSITANRTGKESNNIFTGMSQVVSERGEIILRLDEFVEKVQITEIDIARSKDKQITVRNELLSDRKPEYYHS